jgi:hypothetical protein
MKIIFPTITMLILLAAPLTGCQPVQMETPQPPEPAIPQATATPPARSSPPAATATPGIPEASPTSTVIPDHLAPPPVLSDYAFPDVTDPARQYLFYLHGKIIEDQGFPAIDPVYGEYEYGQILEKLAGNGFEVISEQRPKNTDSGEYAGRVAGQVTALLKAGVPANNITIVGASKGAGITILASDLLKNKEINFVIMAICDPATVEELRQNHLFLYGNVLSIFDSSDQLAGSCQELFSSSEGKGINRYDEIILNVGTGHGILYKPLDEWIIPVVQWAGKP